MKNLQKKFAGEKPLSIADIFLVFGEKCAECEAANLLPTFDYYGRIGLFQFSVHAAPYQPAYSPLFSAITGDRENIGDFIEKCFNAANLLILSNSAFIAQPSKTCQL